MKLGQNTFSDFNMSLTEKKLVIFGASDYLKLIDRNFRDLKLSERASYIVDNAVEKQGRKFNLTGDNLDVFSPVLLKNENADEIVLLIAATSYAWEIYQLLEKDEHYSNVVCFFLMYLIAEHSDDNRDLTDRVNKNQVNQEKSPVIPPKIHCFWFSGGGKDDLSKRCLDSWRIACPDYEIIEWNTDNYDVSKNPYMYEAFKKRKWAFVTDYARLDVLYRYGGFYFDLDVELYRDLDPLRFHDFVIGFGPYRDIEAAAFGTRQENGFVRELLDIYQDRVFDWEKVLAGEIQPVYMNVEFIKKGFLMNGKYQEKGGITIYPKEVFSDRDPFTEEIIKSSSAIGVHHCAGGWWTNDSRNKHEMAKNSMEKIKSLYGGVGE